MGHTLPLLGLPCDVQGKEEMGNRPRVFLLFLSSGGSSYIVQLPGELNMGLAVKHGSPWVEDLREDLPGWRDGYQRRQETAQVSHPLPSTLHKLI